MPDTRTEEPSDAVEVRHEDIGPIPREAPIRLGGSELVPNRKTLSPERLGSID